MKQVQHRVGKTRLCQRKRLNCFLLYCSNGWIVPDNGESIGGICRYIIGRKQMLIFELLIFGFTCWLGCYLLRRASEQVALRWMAVGLLVYALALALNSVGEMAPTELATTLRGQWMLLLAPIVCWLMALWHLREQVRSIPARWRSAENPQTAIGLILISTIAFGLGVGLILTPFDLVPRMWLLLAIGGDLLAFGYAIGVLDAFEQGETLLPDFLRSALEAELVSWLVVGQVLLVLALTDSVTFATSVLLFVLMATTIVLTVFASMWQTVLDKIVFGRTPTLQRERAQLRAITDALPRAQTAALNWDEDEFAKLTRQALSNLGNLPKLATSPLIQLPMIEQRLQQKGGDEGVLGRSAELKLLLTESICKLKPDATLPFDTTDAWRHFNALYFPYVRGLRPYSRRADHHDIDATDRQALDWLQRDIPPRTLYNWQAAAARLVADDLREQLG